eukprot:TRINITY_DN2131_c0_g1_i1.p1 TRINITY_DN2131_c0_g1~~TRINITY_DN2131_c0_g1_i1.p1  ORF type:complete len:380 (-),score=92.65 TRINITY_DN2131_c0_g1_i1:324-1463(-)
MDRVERIMARQKEREEKMRQKEQMNNNNNNNSNNNNNNNNKSKMEYKIERTSTGLLSSSNVIVKTPEQVETDSRKEVWKKDENGKWLVNNTDQNSTPPPLEPPSDSNPYPNSNPNPPPQNHIEAQIQEFEVARTKRVSAWPKYLDPFYTPHVEPRTKTTVRPEAVKHLTEEDAHREASKNRWKRTENGWQQLDSTQLGSSQARSSKWLVGISVPHSDLLSSKENCFYETPATLSSLPPRVYDNLGLSAIIRAFIQDPNDCLDFWWACRILIVLIQQYFGSVFNNGTTHTKIFSDLQIIYTTVTSLFDRYGEQPIKNRRILHTFKQLFITAEQQQQKKKSQNYLRRKESKVKQTLKNYLNSPSGEKTFHSTSTTTLEFPF